MSPPMNRPFVELDSDAIRVQRVTAMRGSEALSTLFRYDLHVELGAPIPDADAVLGAEAVVVLRDRGGSERRVSGVVAEASVHALDIATGRARLVVVPHLWRLTLGRDCRAFQDKTVPEVAAEVLQDYAGRHRWELARACARSPYRAQYRQDGWSYLSRLLEDEGVYVWFDHDAGSMAVFADDSTAAPDVPGGATLRWVRQSGMNAAADAITEIGSTCAATPGAFAARSFDHARPAARLSARAGGGGREWYDAPGAGPRQGHVLARRAADGHEGARARRSGVTGLATSCRPCPGRAFSVACSPAPRLDGRLLCTAIDVRGNDKEPVSTRFDAIPIEAAFRPAGFVADGKQAGLQMARVVGPDGHEVHPDDAGRVRVVMRWDRHGPFDDKGGTWVRVAQRGAPGSLLLPRMGWNVATFNEEGGADAPSLVGRIHDGEHPPEYALPDNKTRVVFKTATVPADGTAHEIHFEDRAGAEVMRIHASRDMSYRVRDSKYETVNGSSTRIVGNVHRLDVADSLDERVIQDQTIAIGAAETADIAGTRMKTVAGNETETIHGSRSVKAGGSHDIAVKGNRSLVVGPAMIDLTLGDIGIVARNAATLVGGAAVKIAAADIAEVAGKASAQVVGAAKVEIAKQDRTLDVVKSLREVVGGAIVVKTNGNFSDNADTTSSWQVGAGLAADAPVIHIEADQVLRLKCGDSVLTLDKDNIALSAKTIDLSGAHLDADTGSKGIDHN